MADVLLNNVYKIYENGFEAVIDANIGISDSEFVVLVGPSGCGKSTTLRMIAGLEDISKGTCSIDGKVVNDVSPKDRDIAMVFQNYALYPHMTVFDNMAFGLKLRKMEKSEIERRVNDVAKILELEHLLERKPKQMSGGQRQRVAIGRAVVRNPKVFLFDEPLSNLDAKLRVQMRTEIKKLHQRLNATTIYVTHDQVEAMTMGDKIVVMKDGIVMQIASPIDVYNNPENLFVAGFIGSPSINIALMEIRSTDGSIELVKDDIVLKLNKKISDLFSTYNNSKVFIGIRPENISTEDNVGNDKTKFCSVKLKAELIEQLGSESYLYVTFYDKMFAIKVKPEYDIKVGDEINCYFDLDKLLLFDALSEKVIQN